MDKLMLKIVTPDRDFYDDEIDMLIARSPLGQFAIMENHVPMVSTLDISYIKIKKDGTERLATISGGYLTFKENQITVISDAAEWKEEIDRERALENKKEAERRIKEAKESSDHDRSELELKKQINRLNLSDL